ncbi:leucine rich adaptor protein 1 isoform X1 [Ascaphus truei]|uniref:leucine rich adaptor protein 1 isoform X1 n=1 Tax=Ascaphus truei TaxID=8439 RepID=UPI003F5911BC
MAQAAGRLEGTCVEPTPDLKDLEAKVGRKTPEGLLRWMREDPVQKLGESGQGVMDSGDHGIGDKIKALKLELACLRAIDVKILQQLLAVNEGIEAVKWILEEKGNLASRCSSLTSSQYSLAESQETSRRGSWNSLQDPTDKLDSISIGSYLDTLADDMDEYSQSTSEPIMSSTPHRQGLSLAYADQDRDRVDQESEGFAGPITLHSRGERDKAKTDKECYRADYMTMSSIGKNTADKTRMSKQVGLLQASSTSQVPVANGLSKHVPTLFKSSTEEKPSKSSTKIKLGQNGKVDLDKCKINSKLHLEYDAHWQWVQSQDDVTFL